MHYLSSDGQPGLHLLSRRGHHCAEDGERAYAAPPIKSLLAVFAVRPIAQPHVISRNSRNGGSMCEA